MSAVTAEQSYWFVANFTAPAYGILTWVGAILCGACVMQCMDYFRTNSGDPLYLKAMALFITLMQVLCSVFEVLGHAQQDRYMANRTIAPGMMIPWTDGPIILVSCLSGMCAQAFYGKLIFRMTQTSTNARRWTWVWAVVFTVLWLAVAGMGFTAFVFFVEVPTKYWDTTYLYVNLVGLPVNFYTAWLVAAAALDLTLSSILVTRFVKDIRRDGFAETNSILTSLAVSTLETFALTATLAIADMICAILVSHTPALIAARFEIVCYFFTVLICRAYCASFLYTLQRHAKVRQMRNNPVSSSNNHKSAGYINSPSANGHRVIRLSPALARTPGSDGPVTASAMILEDGIQIPATPTYGGVKVETEKEQKIERMDGDDYVVPIMRRNIYDSPGSASSGSR